MLEANKLFGTCSDSGRLAHQMKLSRFVGLFKTESVCVEVQMAITQEIFKTKMADKFILWYEYEYFGMHFGTIEKPQKFLVKNVEKTEICSREL